MSDFLVNDHDEIKRQPGMSVDGEGHVRVVESWDDRELPSVALNPVGFASPPAIDATDGLLLFQASQVNQIGLCAHIPHDWKVGTPIVPHIHWWKTSSAAGTVIWQLTYRFSLAGQTAGAYSGFVSGTETVSNANTEEHEAITSWGYVWVPSTYASISCNFIGTLQRYSSGAGADTYAADAKLLKFDFHYAKDGFGSQEPWTKE